MAEYTPKPQILIKRGMNVVLPGDRLAQEYFQYGRNIRSYKVGEWRQRPGMSLLYPPIAESVNHVTRLNNNLLGSFRRFIGTTAGKIWVDNAAHTLLSTADSGYSANGFTSIISRPDRSPNPFLFVANSQRNGKFSTTGARTEWGIEAPTSPPLVEPQGVNYLMIADLDSTAGWTISTGALAAPASTNTTVAVLYDSGSSGMASIAVSDGGALPFPIVNAIIDITNAAAQTEECMIQEVNLAAAPLAGTSGALISSIMYDSGTTGACAITFTGVSSGLQRNTVLLLNNGGGNAEYVRVLSVTTSLEGNPSVRCSTVNTHVAGEIVNGVTAFRAFTVFTHTPRVNAIDLFGFSASYTAVAGDVVTISRNGINVNFTQAPTSSGGSPTARSIKSDDILCFSIQALFNAIEEIQVQIDVGVSGFTTDYYYISIRQPDLIGSVTASSTSILAQQLAFNRRNLDESIRDVEFGNDPPPPIGQIGELTVNDSNPYFSLPNVGDIVPSGAPITVNSNQFQGRADFRIPLSDLQRIGEGPGTLRNVTSVRVVIRYNGTASSGANISVFNISGSYEPSTLELPEYRYVYRGRNTATGSRSNPSPQTRGLINSIRRRTLVTAPVHPDSQVDAIDIFRIGGSLTNYHLIGTVSNLGIAFEDNTPDAVAVRNPMLEIDRFKPWVTSDVPKSGMVNVTGTSVTWVSGDTFNTQWVRGNQIFINQRVYTLYSNPSSTTRLELNESAGEGTNISFTIPEPVLDGQTYPSVFGPYAGSAGEFLFVVGDPRNPGFLYWTNGNDPESTSDVNFIELCNPSEVLMNGCVLDGIAFCFSDKRSWRILPSFEGGQTGAGSSFYSQETTTGKGLAGRYGICVGDAIYFVSFDGVYRTRGDVAESLTDESMAPLFRRDGTFISDFVVPVSPIDFLNPNDISLIFSFDGLYLTFKAVDTNYYTYFMSFLTKGWVLDSIGTGSITRSGRELLTDDADNVIVGTSGGKALIRSNSSFLDDADAISCEFWDREEIWDRLRGTQQVGDVMVDVNPVNATLTPTLRYENNTSNDVLANITGNGRDQFIRDVNSGMGRVVRGVALDLTWTTGSSGSPCLYAWEPAALLKAEETVNRATDWDNGGYTGTKWLQGFRLRGDTLGIAKSFQIEIDGGTFVESFTFTANGEQVVTFWLTNPVVCHEVRMRGSDADLWRNMGVEWIFEPEPERASVWETQVTSLDLPFYSHIREMMVAHQSTTDITMTVTSDGVSLNYTIPNGSGQRIRSYLVQQAVKAKYRSFRFVSSQPFGLWIVDMEVKAGEWGRVDSYRTIKPFGDISRTNGGARI
jgi:hypothetical protein